MKFNGINPTDISPKVFVSHEVINAIPPRALRMLTTSKGGILAGVDYEPREIVLHLNFAGRSHEHANELASKVAALFSTESLGEYEPSHMNGRAFSAVLESAGDLEWKWGFGVVEYHFVAPYPFAHSVAETQVSANGSIRIEPRGNANTRPVIKHVMESTADSLDLSINGNAVFSLRNPLGNPITAGTVFKIDFANRHVSMNNQNGMAWVDYQHTTWHPVILGATNIYLNDGGLTEVRWHDEWM